MKHLDKKWLADRGIRYESVGGPLFLRYNSDYGPVDRICTYYAETEEEAERFLKSATALHVYDNPYVYHVNGGYLMLDGKFYEKEGFYLRCWCFELRDKAKAEFNEDDYQTRGNSSF